MRTVPMQIRSVTGLAAFLALIGSPTPADLHAQASGNGPAVVPREEAYLDSAAPLGSSPPHWTIEEGADRALSVHFAASPASRPELWEAVNWALERWADVPGLPFRFRVTASSESADIRFLWIEAFDDARSGSTDWHVDADGSLAGVTVTLALRHADSLDMSAEFLRLVALHELGHALGLPHSEDPGDVMHPGNRNSALSLRDVRTIQQLYGVEARLGPATPGSSDESRR